MSRRKRCAAAMTKRSLRRGIPHGPKTGAPRPRRLRILLCVSIALALVEVGFGAISARGAPNESPSGYVTLIRVVRTAATEASVLGTSLAPNTAIDVLVGGTVVRSGTTMYQGDYWFLNIPVSDGSVVQTRILGSYSTATTVPAYVPQPVGLPGFVYAKGSELLRDGQLVQLFGVDEQTVFIYGMIASGLWGPADPNAWGKDQLFPSGPETKIPNVGDADSLFREFFRYFLHYNSVSGSPASPKLNVVRIWIVDESWYPEGTYLGWKNNPTAFWNLFDKMVYWAGRAGVYLVPVLGHQASVKDNRFYDVNDVRYAHNVALVRAIMDRYDASPQIAIWDLWNEPDVDDDAYWGSVGGITGFKAWAGTYIADVKPHSAHHLVTMGFGGWTLFPGVPDFGWQYHFFFNDIPGLDVSHHHTYGTAEDQYLIDWETDWHKALGRPHYEGEYGYKL